MFPPMVPLTERVRIEFANHQPEQQAGRPVAPPSAGLLALLRRLFSLRRTEVVPTYNPVQRENSALTAVCEPE